MYLSSSLFIIIIIIIIIIITAPTIRVGAVEGYKRNDRKVNERK